MKPWVLLAITFFLNFPTYLTIYLFISQVYVKARDFSSQCQGLRTEWTWLYLLETRLPHSIAEISEIPRESAGESGALMVSVDV